MFNANFLPMKNFFFLICLFLFIQSYSQHTIVYPDSAYEVVPLDVFETSDGGYLIVSNFADYVGPQGPGHLSSAEIALIKTDINGTQLWSKKYSYTQNGYGVKSFLDQNDELTLFVTAQENTICNSTMNPIGVTYYMIRYNALGDELIHVSLVPDCEERFHDAIEVPGGFIVNGKRSQTGGHGSETFKTFVDINGTVIWKRLIPHNFEEKMVLKGSTIFAATRTVNGLILNQYDLQGQPLGSTTYPTNSHPLTKEIKTTHDGNFIILYEVFDPGVQSWLYEVAKLSPSGTIIWTKQFLDYCISIEERSDSQLYLLKGNPTGLDVEINLMTSTGDSLSTTVHSDPIAADGSSIILAPNGLDYVATGTVGCCFQDTIYGSADAALFTSFQLSSATSEITRFPSTIAPNPTDEMITITVPGQLESNIQFKLFDLTGKMVFRSLLSQQETTLKLPDHLNGFFVYQLQSKNKFSSGKLIIND